MLQSRGDGRADPLGDRSMVPDSYDSPEADSVTAIDQTTLACATSYGIDRTWRVTAEGRRHKIRLQHAYWSGRATIQVDDDVIYHRSSKLIDWGFRQSFLVDGIQFTVQVTVSWLPYQYELLVDDAANASPNRGTAAEPDSVSVRLNA